MIEGEIIARDDKPVYAPGGYVETILTTELPPDELTTASFGFVFCGTDVLFTVGEEDHDHTLDIPGGHKEKEDVSSKDTATREIFEETGITPDNISYIGVQKIVVPEDAMVSKYSVEESYMTFYVGVVKEKKQPNELGRWLTLTEARTGTWVQENRAFFEAMYQESRYLAGQFEKTNLDVFTADGQTKLGVKSYDEVHRQGLWHKGVHIWVLTSDNMVVVQKRGPDVQTKPNMYECAAAGHINSGNTLEETVIEELQEEIGLTIVPEEIIHIGTIVDEFEEMDGLVKNKEFDDIVLIKKDVKISELTISKKEVQSITLLPMKEYLENGMKGDPNSVLRPKEYELLYNYLYS